MYQKIFGAVVLLTAARGLHAQDTLSRPLITLSADAYYRHNTNNPGPDAGVFNNYTSFTNSQNSFELGALSFKAEHSFGKVGIVGDLGFGRRAEEFSYTDEDTRLAIKQLYMSYAPTAALKITAGSWATHVGYELVDAYANRNYSMSHLFSKGPFFHTGIKGELTLGRSGLMAGLTNPTDLKSASFSRKYFIAQYSFALAEGWKTYLNYQGGKPGADARARQYDLVLTGTLSGTTGIGLNGSVASSRQRVDGKYNKAASWWGSAAYFNWDPLPSLGFTLREEYFSDDHQLTDLFSTTPQGGSVFSSTLSANLRIGALTLIPELRHDRATRSIYLDSQGAGDRSTTSLLLAATYKFSYQ